MKKWTMQERVVMAIINMIALIGAIITCGPVYAQEGGSAHMVETTNILTVTWLAVQHGYTAFYNGVLQWLGW